MELELFIQNKKVDITSYTYWTYGTHTEIAILCYHTQRLGFCENKGDVSKKQDLNKKL